MRTSTKKIYYKNGSLKEVRIFKDGLKHGKWIYYYKNGNIHYYKSYKNGKLEGLGEHTVDEAGIIYKGQFKNGEYEGTGRYIREDPPEFSETYTGKFKGGRYHGCGLLERSKQFDCGNGEEEEDCYKASGFFKEGVVYGRANITHNKKTKKVWLGRIYCRWGC